MSINVLKLEVVTPERLVFSGTVSDVLFPGVGGWCGILPGHTPLLAPLANGLVQYHQDGKAGCVTVFGGFAEVGPEQVTILADVSETPEQLNAEELAQALEAANAKLKAAHDEASTQEAQDLIEAVHIRQQALNGPEH